MSRLSFEFPRSSANQGRSKASFVAAIAMFLLAPAAHAGARAVPPAASCGTRALALSEALEPVIEAVTDGKPGRVAAASHAAQGWWAAHRVEFADTASIAPLMRVLAVEAGSHHAPLAARAAVRAAAAALDACPEAANSPALLMRLDLAAMAAWLRAHGVDVEFPRSVKQSADTLTARLRARGRGALADRLAADVAAALAIPVRLEGDIPAANRLLERVDEVERVLP